MIRYYLILFILFTSFLHAQSDKIEQLNKIKFTFKKETEAYYSANYLLKPNLKAAFLPDSIKTDSIKTLPVNKDTTKSEQKKVLLDSTLYSKYGTLLNDDPEYTKKVPLWGPVVGVVGGNLFIAAINRYIFNEPWERIGFNSILANFRSGWEWDQDRFGVNFFQHPYSGALGFNHARSQGYSFWESAPFAFCSSLMWEQFMENTVPSYNDLINTTLTGILEGEIFYRLSSVFLDERITGFKRVLRETIAGILDPVRLFYRLTSGKYKRVTDKEIYQTEPLQASLFMGIRNINEGSEVWKGQNSGEIAFNFSYGDPLEKRIRKPFDYFKFRIGFSLGAGRKIINNILGYGIITGRNIVGPHSGILYGLFQNYDYWDNNIDQIGTLGAGLGIIHRYNFSEHSDITSHFHLGVIPMAGIKGPLADSVGERNYNYTGGFEAMLQTSMK